MKKDELTKLICAIVIDTSPIKKSSFCGRNTAYKQGLYFLYNNSDDVIYIGMLGDGDSTSLYDRMVGHGTGAHSKESWYPDVVYGKF